MATNAGQFSKSVVTTAGKEMIVQAQNGHTLTFTRVALGDGTLAEGEDMLALTAIKSEKLSANISSFLDKGNGQYQLKFNVNNTTLDTGFWHREIGVMAKIDDGDEELYAYSYAGAAANFLYDKTTPVQERFVNIDVLIGSATDVTVVIDGSVVYPSREETEAMIQTHNDDAESHKDVYGRFIRQRHTTYALKDVVYLPSLGAKWYLECTSPGTTPNTDLTVTSPAAGNTVTDGTVVWTIRKVMNPTDIPDSTPPGTIMAFAGNSTPSGFLLCDGSAVSRTTYADLFAAIGTTWGSGNGSTTFNLPNLNGYWLKGSSTAGSSVSAGLPNINGSWYSHIYSMIDATGAVQSTTTTKNATSNAGGATGKFTQFTFKASSSNSIYGSSSTVSVSSKTVRYIIKY